MKVFECKAYPLLKRADNPPKSEKRSPRAFISYLVGYDFTNILRIWNSEKETVNGYRDVIFDETEYFDTYKAIDLIKVAEKVSFVEFVVHDPRPASTPISSGDEIWLQTLIRDRESVLSRSGEGVVLGEVEESPETQRPPQTPKQLDTPDDTPFMLLIDRFVTTRGMEEVRYFHLFLALAFPLTKPLLTAMA